MNQFVILSVGVDPLSWPSFIEIAEIACSTPAWCTHGLTLKQQQQSKSSKCDVQHGCAFKVAGYSFGKLHIDNLKGRLLCLNQYP